MAWKRNSKIKYIILSSSSFLFVLLLGCSSDLNKNSNQPFPQGPSLPSSRYPQGPVNISAVWANEGGEKITQSELRASKGEKSTLSSIWDGKKVRLSGAKNEVINFNLILEAEKRDATQIKVVFNTLLHPDGSVIRTTDFASDKIFNWINRPIELFYIKYLPIRGLSRLAYQIYDERHIPAGLQRPINSEGAGVGSWNDRPNHDKNYPDIAVPLELVSQFNIEKGQNQAIWTDIYIPSSSSAGNYNGLIEIYEGSRLSLQIPIELEVYDFSLPDEPTLKTMLYLGDYGDLSKLYIGEDWAQPGPSSDMITLIRDRHFMLAHRHRISLIDSDVTSELWTHDSPSPEWIPRLDGSLFTHSKGYAGPGENVGNGVYSIGTYGSWSWKEESRKEMWDHTDAWEEWFSSYFPDTEHFLYLDDEPKDLEQIKKWLEWMNSNPGIGSKLPSFVTIPLVTALEKVPTLTISATGFTVGDKDQWEKAISQVEIENHLNREGPRKRIYMYNGQRPAEGSFATEDDGIALRELAWGQYKKKIDRWYYWQGTYYNDFQSGRGLNNVFESAHTFGSFSNKDEILGETGWLYTNGDGVLFYPGTEKAHPKNSYEVLGPIASLRLKYWRRGIQDADYLALAYEIDPNATQAILEKMVPKVLWEYGISDPSDPTFVISDISWSINPDDWEKARKELAEIILSE